DARPRQHPAIFQLHRQGFIARCDGAVWLQDRLDEIHPSEALADAGQIRTDLLSLAAQVMALETLRLANVQKQLAAALDVAAARQRRLNERLMVGALLAEAHVELGLAFDRRDLHNDAVDALGQRSIKPIGVRCELAGIGTLMQELAVEPETQGAVAAREELH